MMAISLLLKVTITTASALLGARLAARRSASARHVLLAAAFAMLVILPIAPAFSPTVRVSVPAALGDVIAPETTEATAESDTVPTAMGAGAPRDTAGPRISWPSLPVLLVTLWVAGAIVFLARIAMGLMRVRALRRHALPWTEGRHAVEALAAEIGVRQQVDVLLHESVPGPMTCGVVRPAIMLPIDVRNWAPEDLRRAIVHELEHVRRRDWISHCLARMVAACYWFHPIVWVAWHQFALEAERACDDAVLRRSEPTDYADQLVGLAQRLSRSTSQPLLAMANRSDLATRVVAVLDATQRRGRAGGVWVAGAIIITATIAVGLSSIRIVAAVQAPQAQSANPTGGKQRYDVASIKPCEPEENPTGARGTAGGTNATFSPGRFYVPCVTTQQLIFLAYAGYGVTPDEYLINDSPGGGSNATKVRGGPDWVHSLREKYRIEAIAEGATERTVLAGAMLRTLLEERFKLKLHREQEIVDMYAMKVGKSGLKVKPMKPGDCNPDFQAPADKAKPYCGMMTMGANGPNTSWLLSGMPLSTLANRLSSAVGMKVIDQTGVNDEFIIRFEFHPDDATPGIKWPADRDADTSVPRAASIFTALDEQLGLKLEKVKAPRGYLVIDSIERPKPDAPEAFAAPPARALGAYTPPRR